MKIKISSMINICVIAYCQNMLSIIFIKSAIFSLEYLNFFSEIKGKDSYVGRIASGIWFEMQCYFKRSHNGTPYPWCSDIC